LLQRLKRRRDEQKLEQCKNDQVANLSLVVDELVGFIGKRE
jgi:hypothetical protein